MEENSEKLTNTLELPVFVAPNEEKQIPVSAENITPTSYTKECMKNFKPQFCSVGAGALVFIASGMSLTYGVTRNFSVEWSIGGILGAVFAALVSRCLTMKILMYQAGLLVTFSGLLTLMSVNGFASVVSGMAAGTAFVPTFMAISEQADASIRGFIASGIDSICFGLGICLTLLIQMFFWEIQSPYIGWINFFIGLGAVRMTFCWAQESPVWYLLQGREEEAVEAQQLLQQSYAVIDDVIDKISAHKRYIERNNLLSLKESSIQGFDALLKICFLRILLTLALSEMIFFCHEPGSIATRLLGAVIGSCVVDIFGRRYLACFAIALSALFALTVAIARPFNLLGLNLALLCFYQLAMGIIASTSAAYMSEAFPLQVKPYFFAVVFSVEKFLQIVLASAYCYEAIYAYFYILTVLGVIALYAVQQYMPETKQMQLLEAQEKFAECTVDKSGRKITSKIGYV